MDCPWPELHARSFAGVADILAHEICCAGHDARNDRTIVPVEVDHALHAGSSAYDSGHDRAFLGIWPRLGHVLAPPDEAAAVPPGDDDQVYPNLRPGRDFDSQIRNRNSVRAEELHDRAPSQHSPTGPARAVSPDNGPTPLPVHAL